MNIWIPTDLLQPAMIVVGTVLYIFCAGITHGLLVKHVSPNVHDEWGPGWFAAIFFWPVSLIVWICLNIVNAGAKLVIRADKPSEGVHDE